MLYPRALRVLLLALISLLLPVRSLADSAFHIHVLDRPDAARLAAVIQPLLPEGGSVQVYRGQLIIRTTDANMAELEQTLGQLNSQPVTIIVHLRRQASTASSQHENRSTVHIQVPGGADGQIHFQHRGQRNEQLNQYHIRTLSGYAARIGTDTLVALTDGWPLTTRLVALQQGIEVLPTMTGDGDVTLQISQIFTQPGGGQYSATTMRVQPGHWQPIGSIRIDQQSDMTGTGGSQHHSQHVTVPLEVMAEVIR